MTNEYIDVIIDDTLRLFRKKGRASDCEYLLLIKRLTILKEKLNDTKSRISNRLGTETAEEVEGES